MDLQTWQITGTYPTGQNPDVLAYDPVGHRLYVAAESGWLTVLDQHDRLMTVSSRTYLAEDAHVVVIDPTTGRSYYPVPHGPGGHPALLTYESTH
jgi:DNA-binding beta-propeller fold protein YncE